LRLAVLAQPFPDAYLEVLLGPLITTEKTSAELTRTSTPPSPTNAAGMAKALAELGAANSIFVPPFPETPLLAWVRTDAVRRPLSDGGELGAMWLDGARGDLVHVFKAGSHLIAAVTTLPTEERAPDHAKAGAFPYPDLNSPLLSIPEGDRNILTMWVNSAPWTFMRTALDARVQAGAVDLYARIGSPTSVVSLVPPDVFAHFDVESWWRGVAVCHATGERLFSLHALDSGAWGEVPTASPAALDDFKATAAAENRCFRWLIEEMRKSPDSSPKSREDFLVEAKTKFRGLSDRAFERAWKNAINQTGAEAWSKPGRRPGNSRT
jgi:hypothetical protein